MLLDLLCSVAGFEWVICLVGAVREILGNGTMLGVPVLDWKIPGLLFPFAGFILIGFLAAVMQKLRNALKDGEKRTEPDSESK